ncbi:tyrosine-protein phosphatase [Petrocella sp. FN5]|uniref:tyrosine-protein phosphatase n=1 Tax=Petrocella sp. FN5 TaxID=3032002 RepID=UPI0023DB181D|nr:CpsB/CapC family capsule biosynthesis tyrosine phosphatase [Petrocella sp. FN5]MDF1616632.1 hypothetical protein [Petrocella sp. FN5]
MIDTHIHILSNVDDGPKTVSESIKMARMAIDEGITEMIVTPHYKRPGYTNEKVHASYESLKKELIKQDINLKLYMGNEIYLSEDNVMDLMEKKAYTLNDGPYVLVELPFRHYFPFHDVLLHQLQLKGYKVILAHAERYEALIHQPNKIKELVDRNIYIQLTGNALLNKKTKKIGFKWIKLGLVHLISTDAHDTSVRKPTIKKAYNQVMKKIGKDAAELIFVDNPKAVINGYDMERPTLTENKMKFLTL